MRKVIASLVAGFALLLTGLSAAPASATEADVPNYPADPGCSWVYNPSAGTYEQSCPDEQVCPVVNVEDSPEYKALEEKYWERVSLHYQAEGRVWMLTNDLNGVKAQLADANATVDRLTAKVERKNATIKDLRKRLRALQG